MFFDRSRKAGPYLEWKVRFFTVGAVLAVVGMALNQRWMTWSAIGVLVAGMLLRFLPAGRIREVDDVPPEDGSPEDGSPGG